MKKLMILAAVAALLVAGPASAQWGRHAVAEPNATFAFGTAGAAAGPSTTNNDDSCDISTAPAATLLLPYFEVDPTQRGTTTFFTVVNTSAVPQIAHVTIWTDWSYPVLDFNIYLTGYDVQPIDLYDVIVNGVIAPNGTATPGTGIGGTAPTYATSSFAGYGNTTNGKTNGGSGSTYNTYNFIGNPNFNPAVYTAALNTSGVPACSQLPGQLRQDTQQAVLSALTTGIYNPSAAAGACGTTEVGGVHANAIGYVTIDVNASCNTLFPTDATYYSGTTGILYDNVLTGDYEILDKATGTNYAGGNPLVHIRAIPEGGNAGSLPTDPTVLAATNLPYTFYSRYINTTTGGVANNRDRRQPLPSIFAARWIQGGPLSLNTNYRIWREGVTGAVGAAAGSTFPTPTTCSNAVDNSTIPLTEFVRFDEHENFLTASGPTGCPYSPCPPGPSGITLPETSSPSVTSSTFPAASFASGDVAGWMYMNLNNNDTAAPTLNAGATGPFFDGTRASQNWVIVALSGSGSSAGAYSVDFDATWLGNGCSGAVGASSLTGGTYVIGPFGGTPVCPAGFTCTSNGVSTAPGYTGTNVTP